MVRTWGASMVRTQPGTPREPMPSWPPTAGWQQPRCGRAAVVIGSLLGVRAGQEPLAIRPGTPSLCSAFMSET